MWGFHFMNYLSDKAEFLFDIAFSKSTEKFRIRESGIGSLLFEEISILITFDSLLTWHSHQCNPISLCLRVCLQPQVKSDSQAYNFRALSAAWISDRK